LVATNDLWGNKQDLTQRLGEAAGGQLMPIGWSGREALIATNDRWGKRQTDAKTQDISRRLETKNYKYMRTHSQYFD
jgi:hypothetical protein